MARGSRINEPDAAPGNTRPITRSAGRFRLLQSPLDDRQEASLLAFFQSVEPSLPVMNCGSCVPL